MGDSRRFREFASVVSDHFPDRDLKVADVASGKGQLQAALRQMGYKNIVSWDTRHKNAKRPFYYQYGMFDFRTAPAYDLVLGMHPDQATDHIIAYAVKHRRPFVVCPCCVMPSAVEYGGLVAKHWSWMRHLVNYAVAGKMTVKLVKMPFEGRNRAIIGVPKRGR